MDGDILKAKFGSKDIYKKEEPMRHQYTDNELKQILANMVILTDTREKTSHINKWFDEKKVKHRRCCLNYGDYSFCVEPNNVLGNHRDIYYTNSIAIEKKSGLDELSGNLAQNRDRFENEWLRAKDTKKILLIENGSLCDIWDNAYSTQFKPDSYMASLLTFTERYNIIPMFVNKEYTARLIYLLCYYHLREKLRG
jgi:ERCC4-type nuclease